MAPSLLLNADLPTYNDVRGSFNKYRSIAYGTWKPGEARRFSEKAKRRLFFETPAYSKNDSTTIKNLNSSSSLIRHKSEISLDSKTLVPTEDEVSEIEHCRTDPICTAHTCAQTTPSLGTRKASTRFNQVMTISFDPDCYSSAEYLNYCISKDVGNFSRNMPLSKMTNRSMDALNERLVHSDLTRVLQRQNPSTSTKIEGILNPPIHQRTRSFDSATHYAVISPGKNAKLSSFGQKQSTSNQKTGAIQATKNFLKKLYNNSTTLPKKLRSGKSQQKLDRFKAATSPFYEIRYPEPEEIPYLPYNIQYEVESDNGDEETELDIATEELDSSTAPSCSSSTPDKNLNPKMNIDEGVFSGSEDKSVTGSDFTTQSYGTSSSSASRSGHQQDQPKFQSWNDLFGHLKKEICEMRVRDAQILESLKTVESQLHYVRDLDRSQSEYSPLERLLTAPTTIPAGSRPLNTPSSPRPVSGSPLKSTFV
ncbi:hypothetical protein FO519_008144 [Halicephalobus sp. NKZ332]|nr:hypothetical protein FO519_008144 [Halicephalobus sp. NKZ332]